MDTKSMGRWGWLVVLACVFVSVGVASGQEPAPADASATPKPVIPPPRAECPKDKAITPSPYALKEAGIFVADYRHGGRLREA